LTGSASSLAATRSRVDSEPASSEEVDEENRGVASSEEVDEENRGVASSEEVDEENRGVASASTEPPAPPPIESGDGSEPQAAAMQVEVGVEMHPTGSASSDGRFEVLTPAASSQAPVAGAGVVHVHGSLLSAPRALAAPGDGGASNSGSSDDGTMGHVREEEEETRECLSDTSTDLNDVLQLVVKDKPTETTAPGAYLYTNRVLRSPTVFRISGLME
jgi:hypothetical protein